MPEEFRDRPFAVADARSKGLGRTRMGGSDLVRPFHGVRMPRGTSDTLLSMCRAYAARMPPNHFFSHLTAARLWGIPLAKPFEPSELLHVTAVVPARAPRTHGIIGHHTWDGSVLVTDRDGLAVSDPISTWCQLASLIGLDDLVAAGDYLILDPTIPDPGEDRPYADLDDISARVASYRGRGSRPLRQALMSLRQGSESRPESLLRQAMLRAGLPEPELNWNLYDSRARFLGRADMVYPEWRVIVEYDGDQHRTDTHQYDRDITRIESFAREGWFVVRVRAHGLFPNPSASIARIESALLTAGWRRR